MIARLCALAASLWLGDAIQAHKRLKMLRQDSN